MATPQPNIGSWISDIRYQDLDADKSKFNYTIEIGTGFGAKKITVEFIENKNLSETELNIKKLGHIILLKELKDTFNDDPENEALAVGREVQLLTDKDDIESSTKSMLAFKKFNDGQDTKPDNFYFDVQKNIQEVPKDSQERVKLMTDLNQELKQLCKNIQELAFKQFLSSSKPPQSPTKPQETIVFNTPNISLPLTEANVLADHRQYSDQSSASDDDSSSQTTFHSPRSRLSAIEDDDSSSQTTFHSPRSSFSDNEDDEISSTTSLNDPDSNAINEIEVDDFGRDPSN
jgi:hypothetical protein